MNPDQLFDAWAPPESIWTPWAKPILFVQSPSSAGRDSLAWSHHDVSWAPETDQNTAMVLDVPGRISIEVGIALAELGYRPVPLFNTCSGPRAIVNVDRICSAFEPGAELLKDMRIDNDAPPAFLLDADRMLGTSKKAASPGDFDNRWLVFPQDFPSANFLLSQEIRSVVLVQSGREKPADDVSHVLRRWQEAGITILAKNLANDAAVAHIDVPRPRLYRLAWRRVLAALGLRRNAAGGFGAVIPHVQSGVG